MHQSNFDPFKNQPGSNEETVFDPTNPALMRTHSGSEIPEPERSDFLSGTRHPTMADIGPFVCQPEPGAMTLPATIPLLARDGQDPCVRQPHYGIDLTFQAEHRSKHTIVFGPTGAGKNTLVLDPFRFSAIADPNQTVISFSLKSTDYGPVRTLCEITGKPLIVVNLNDSWRSVGWNPLATNDASAAIDEIRRFADSVRNPNANETEFWQQWIKTALTAAWLAGERSFPRMYELFSLPQSDLLKRLDKFDNAGASQLASFLRGGSHNAETVLASIIGALTPFLAESVRRVMAEDELKLDQVFQQPVCLHVEMPETSLETQRALFQMLARCVTDALINNAERAAGEAIPATFFLDDMPSLGYLLSPERLLTMRSRGIGIVAGVQSLSSLELAYGSASQALIDNFHTTIVLPGGPANDAEHFAQASGEQLVALHMTESQSNPHLVKRPLLSSAHIRTPSYRHNLLGLPATLMLGAITFQAYLQRSYEVPGIAQVLRSSRRFTGKEKLRESQCPKRQKKRRALRRKRNTVQDDDLFDLVGDEGAYLEDELGLIGDEDSE